MEPCVVPWLYAMMKIVEISSTGNASNYLFEKCRAYRFTLDLIQRSLSLVMPSLIGANLWHFSSSKERGGSVLSDMDPDDLAAVKIRSYRNEAVVRRWRLLMRSILMLEVKKGGTKVKRIGQHLVRLRVFIELLFDGQVILNLHRSRNFDCDLSWMTFYLHSHHGFINSWTEIQKTHLFHGVWTSHH